MKIIGHMNKILISPIYDYYKAFIFNEVYLY